MTLVKRIGYNQSYRNYLSWI